MNEKIQPVKVLKAFAEEMNDELDTKNVIKIFHYVTCHLFKENFKDEVLFAINLMSCAVKVVGKLLELDFPELLDNFQDTLRNACKNSKLNIMARLKLLEILELRSLRWEGNENVENYYKDKFLQLEKEQKIDAKEALYPIDDLKHKLDKFVLAKCKRLDTFGTALSSFKSREATITMKDIFNIKRQARLKELYLGISISDLNSQAQIDAASCLNPLMLKESAFAYLCDILHDAGEAYNDPFEVDQERVYTLYKKFIIVYNELSKRDTGCGKDNGILRLRKELPVARAVVNVIKEELEKRYVAKEKEHIYKYAQNMMSELQIEPTRCVLPAECDKLKSKNELLDKKYKGNNEIFHKNDGVMKNYSRNEGRYAQDQCQDVDQVINVGEHDYLIVQGNDPATTKMAKYVLENFIHWGMSKRKENARQKCGQPGIFKGNKTTSYARKSMLIVAKQSLCKQVFLDWKIPNLECEEIILPNYQQVHESSAIRNMKYPEYVQAKLSAMHNTTSKKYIPNPKVSRTLRATLETWDKAAKKWVQIPTHNESLVSADYNSDCS